MTHSTTRPQPARVEDLLGPPERAGATISPDGRRIAYLAPWRTRLNVWVLDLDGSGDVDLGAARRVTADDHRAVLDHRWTDDPRYLLYLQDTDGDENHHVFRVDLDDPDSTPVDLTPYPGVRVWRLQQLPGTGSVVVEINHRARDRIDVCELDLATGELTVLAESRGDVLGWVVTPQREVYGWSVSESGWDLRQQVADGGQRHVTTLPGDDHPLGAAVCEPTPDGRGLWIGSHRGSDRLRLARLDLATAEQTELDSHPTHDLDTRSAVFPLLPPPLITDRRTGELVGVRYSRERQGIRPLTGHFAEVLAALEALSDGDLGAVSSDEAGRRWVVSFVHDRDPTTWFYDHLTGEARLLYRPHPRLDPEALAPMTPVTITARDGLELPSYLLLPVGHDTEQGALPLILMPHGGPWARDAWSFNPFAQYFATRGYAVLLPNFRGSTGFGKAHMQAAIGEFGGAMHDDLVDAVEWAVARGHADPARVGILGGSYGGYAALVGVTTTPDLFAAAVDYVGVSDLANYMRTIPQAVRPALRHNFHRYVGDPDVAEQEAEMLARSPITHLDAVTTPLMIFQGANDVRVVQAESDNVVERLRARGVEVSYRVFADEGHAFVNPENLTTMIREAGRFLAEHLGGEP